MTTALSTSVDQASVDQTAVDRQCSIAALDGPLDGLCSIDLTELEAAAMLQVRRDRKYLVSADLAAELVTELPTGSRVLEIDGLRTFGYRSVYFDTAELVSFLGAARGRPDRFKVRTRDYLDAGPCNLELKRPDHRGRTTKIRTAHDAGDPTTLGPSARSFLGQFPETAPHRDGLRATLTTAYRRSTVVLPEAARVTLDARFSCTTPDGDRLAAPGLVFIETKSAGPPTAVDRMLWSRGVRPVRVSKFGAGMVALHPELPHNRWWRTVGRLREYGADG